jgi:hypothetical protein
MIKFLLATFFTLSVSAKLFPIPFNKQLNEADGIIYGEFLGQNYKKMHNGKVVTEASFRLVQSVGLDNRYLVNKNLFRIYFDGGIWQGLGHQNANAPVFKLEKEYVILLKKTEFGFKPLMDKLGSYKVIRDRDVFGIRSMAFPKHPKIGFLPYKTFDLWVKTVYGSYMSDSRANKFVYIPSKKVDRAPASLSEDKPVSKKSKINIFWVAIAFGVLGALRMRQLRHSK